MNSKTKIGDIFGRLTILKIFTPKGKPTYYICKCKCGNIKTIVGNDIRRGVTKSCGCLEKESRHSNNKKYNKYNLNGLYGIGWTNKGYEFYFDLSDFHKIKNYSWHSRGGYIITEINNKIVTMQNIILSEKGLIDHINRYKNDNRKENLRYVNNSQNVMNRSVCKNNKSGITGVAWDNIRCKWYSRIGLNRKNIYLGRFDNKKDAVVARLKAEKEYFGNFSPQIHLFKEYEI